jgi:hypothetical protein
LVKDRDDIRIENLHVYMRLINLMNVVNQVHRNREWSQVSHTVHDTCDMQASQQKWKENECFYLSPGCLLL